MKGVGWMRKAMAFTLGSILGGVIGALTALLLAPYSGDELRSLFQQRVENIQLEVKEAALQKRAELEEQLQEMINAHDS
jgi:gas vesicle protein